jgi:hypothetical protein
MLPLAVAAAPSVAQRSARPRDLTAVRQRTGRERAGACGAPPRAERGCAGDRDKAGRGRAGRRAGAGEAAGRGRRGEAVALRPRPREPPGATAGSWSGGSVSGSCARSRARGGRAPQLCDRGRVADLPCDGPATLCVMVGRLARRMQTGTSSVARAWRWTGCGRGGSRAPAPGGAARYPRACFVKDPLNWISNCLRER